MSKELTPLEAVANIRQLFIGSSINISKQLDIIETALKRLETIDEVGVITGTSTTEEADKEIEEYLANKKKLKALEIIKKLIIDFSFNYGGKMGNVIKIRIGDGIIRLHFQEGDKNFEIIKEFLYA